MKNPSTIPKRVTLAQLEKLLCKKNTWALDLKGLETHVGLVDVTTIDFDNPRVKTVNLRKTILEIIEFTYKMAYREGIKDKKNEIQIALGLK